MILLNWHDWQCPECNFSGPRSSQPGRDLLRKIALVGVLAVPPNQACCSSYPWTVSSGHDVSGDLREFLTTRRARLSPQQAGLPDYGHRRRVAGLRREEVALLAGISIEYYTRLERGNARGFSDEVVGGVARALQLDDVEQTYLANLVRAANPSSTTPRPATQHRIRPSVQHVLDSMTTAAFVRNGRMDLLSANKLGYALYSPAFIDPIRPINLARFLFLDPQATTFYREWDDTANGSVGHLRAEAARNRSDNALTTLIQELCAQSEAFRTRWAAHDVNQHRTGAIWFHHPLVGDLDLEYNALELPSDPGLTIVAYTAPPDSETYEAVQLLGSAAPAQVRG